jgi:hypothetical protein
LQPDFEIEDLINPKDELNKKIVTLACTIRKWNEETAKVRKTVKKQIEEIVNSALNKYNMENTELRRLVEKIFRYYSVSESWIRKLLPIELKDSSKTRISYLQKQEIEKERRRLLLLQQGASESQHESDQESSPISLDSQDRLAPEDYTTTDMASKTYQFPASASNDHTRIELKTKKDKLFEADQEIERLKENVRRLSEQFDATTYLQTAEQDIPLIAQIDPVKKVIISIRVGDTHI